MKKILLTVIFVSLTGHSHADFLGDLINRVTGSDAASPTVTTSPTNIVSATNTESKVEANSGAPLKHTAQIRILDKRTNRLETLTQKTTAPLVFDDLRIQIQNCLRHHQQVGHHAAFMTIASTDELIEGDISPPYFSGWMLSAFPAVAALEHPRYDVRLVECLR